MNDSREQEINNLISSLTTSNDTSNSVQNNELINSLTTPNSNEGSNMNTMPEQVDQTYNEQTMENPVFNNDNNYNQQVMYNNVPMDNYTQDQAMYNNVPMDGYTQDQTMYNNVPMDNYTQDQTMYNNVPMDGYTQDQAMYNDVPMDGYTQDQTMYNNVPMDGYTQDQAIYNDVPMDGYTQDQTMYNNVPMDDYTQDQAMYNNVPIANVMPEQTEYNNEPTENVMPEQNVQMENTVPEQTVPKENPVVPTVAKEDKKVDKPKQAVSSNPVSIESNLDKDFGDDLIKAYVGKNYEKISTKKFNFAAFFLTAFYLFYRKSFLYGVLFLIVPPLLLALFPDYSLFVLIAYFVASIFIGITFNKTYITKGNAKIYQFKLDNLHANLGELEKKCAEEGGTAVGNIFAGLATTTVLMIGLSFLLNMFNISLWDNLFYNYNYEGILIYDVDTDVEKTFVVTIPDAFKKDITTGMFEYSYSKEKKKGYDQCKLTFNALRSFRNDKKLIMQMKEFYKDSQPTSVTEQESNGIKWYGFSLTNSFGKYYYYATKYDDKIYLYTFEIMDLNSSECENYSKGILLSIKQKSVVEEEQRNNQKKKQAQNQNTNNQNNNSTNTNNQKTDNKEEKKDQK